MVSFHQQGVTVGIIEFVLGKGGGKPVDLSYEEGRRLYELGAICASNFKFDEALEYYSRSIDVCPNPAPYVNRAIILCRRIRYHEALMDLLKAKKVDLMQSDEFGAEIDTLVEAAIT